jgi:hypothetical protein
MYLLKVRSCKYTLEWILLPLQFLLEAPLKANGYTQKTIQLSINEWLRNKKATIYLNGTGFYLI